VDGTGIQRITDSKLARALRDKVNDFNAQTARRVVVLTLAYVIIPELFAMTGLF